MNPTINSILASFRGKSTLMQLIIVNVAIFAALRILGVLFTLANSSVNIIEWIGMPSALLTFITRPWTIITYMFVQYDILHILFNMLMLYWFGTLFMNFFNSRQLLSLYIWGGIGGALFYMLLYGILPESAFGVSGVLIGASASVLAIVVAVAMRAPNFSVYLFLIGGVKLKWLALIFMFIDFISITGANAGGHLSHLGGAVAGLLYMPLLRRGYALRLPDLSRMMQSVRKKFQKQKPRKHSSKPQTDIEEMDKILEKIKKSGYTALTDEEKDRLFNVSRKI